MPQKNPLWTFLKDIWNKDHTQNTKKKEKKKGTDTNGKKHFTEIKIKKHCVYPRVATLVHGFCVFVSDN